MANTSVAGIVGQTPGAGNQLGRKSLAHDAALAAGRS